jgi:SAM-dependent methyltransferase
MGAQFGATYASAYDAMYRDKDYEGECDLVEEAFRRFADGDVRTVLDLGCGTGNHAVPLARRGYAVAGVDLSEPMLARARGKAAEAGVEVDLRQGDVRDADLGRRFDAALLMFAVIGYQRTNDDVRATLRTVRRHLRPGGVLVFDTWFGPGVLVSPPGSGERTIETEDGPIKREVTGSLDVRRHLSTVAYRLIGQGRDEREEHVMRFFFPLELELFCALEGLELLTLSPVGSLDGELTRETWNALGAARAV